MTQMSHDFGVKSEQSRERHQLGSLGNFTEQAELPVSVFTTNKRAAQHRTSHNYEPNSAIQSTHPSSAGGELAYSSKGLVRIDMFKPEGVTAPKFADSRRKSSEAATDDLEAVNVAQSQEYNSRAPQILSQNRQEKRKTALCAKQLQQLLA